MKEARKVRRNWGNEEKIFFCKMLQTPLKTGHSKTVSQVSDEYGVSAKLLYTWLGLYTQQGERGFEKKPRKVYKSKSKDLELAEQLCALSILHPDQGAQKLIDRLKAQNPELSTPSIPTVLKILRENNLGSTEQRFGAAERLFVKSSTHIPETLVKLLLNHNPCLRLREFNEQVDGLIILVKSIPLSHFFKDTKDFLFVAIEANSLIAFGRTWDGKDLGDLKLLMSIVTNFVQGDRKENVFFVAEENSVFKKMGSQISWLNTNTHDIDIAKYFDAIKPRFNAIRRFLRHYEFQDTSNLNTDLDGFLNIHILSSRNLGYPNFGEPPFYTVKNHREKLYFNSLQKQ